MTYLIDLFEFEVEEAESLLGESIHKTDDPSILSTYFENLDTYEISPEQALILRLRFPNALMYNDRRMILDRQ